MRKSEENQDSFDLLSVQDQDDEELNHWIQSRFMEEEAAIEKELDNIPDSKDWEPTEEKFQELMRKARDRGLFKDLEEPAINVDDRNDKIYEKSAKSKQRLNQNLNHESKINVLQDRQGRKTFFKGAFIKWTAAAAVTAFGLFGVSMSSQANRTYLMEEVSKAFGNNLNTKINNGKVLESDEDFAQVLEDIKNTLGVTVPEFFYMPDQMVFESYTIDQESQTAVIQYSYQEDIVYFMIVSNEKEASGLLQGDTGVQIKEIQSDLTGDLKLNLWEIKGSEDKKITYMLNWKYRNSYYELVGKFEEAEIESIARKIMY